MKIVWQQKIEVCLLFRCLLVGCLLSNVIMLSMEVILSRQKFSDEKI